MNKVVILGRIIGEVRTKKTKNGAPYARFAIANSNVQISWEGRQFERSSVIPCVCFGDMATAMLRRFKVGDQLIISGPLQSSTYKDAEGREINAMSVKVEEFYPIECDPKSTKIERHAAWSAEKDDYSFENKYRERKR